MLWNRITSFTQWSIDSLYQIQSTLLFTGLIPSPYLPIQLSKKKKKIMNALIQ